MNIISGFDCSSFEVQSVTWVGTKEILCCMQILVMKSNDKSQILCFYL